MTISLEPPELKCLQPIVSIPFSLADFDVEQVHSAKLELVLQAESSKTSM